MLERVIQFFKNIRYAFMKSDENLVSSILMEEEVLLFRRLKKSEQIHSELVTKDFIRSEKGKLDQSLLKAVLLHDIGKIERPLNLIEKSMAVIFHKTGLSKISWIHNLPFMKSYLYHAERGANLLVKHGVFPEGSLEEQLVRSHHEQQETMERNLPKDHPLLQLHTKLKKADDSN
jgi:hypothetical protein